MKTLYATFQQPNLESFYAFAKMNNTEKTSMLKTRGVLLDEDPGTENLVNLYYLNGFFVEETLSGSQQNVVDIIPYKHGFRLETYAEIRPAVVPKHYKYLH